MAHALTDSDLPAVPSDHLALLARILRPALPFHEARRIATDLLRTFGTLPGVVFADPLHLERAGASLLVQSEIALTRTVQEDLARARIRDRPLIGAWHELVAYCRVHLAESRIECLRVLYLDRKNRLIADEELSRGTLDHVAVYPRRVVGRALDHDASALILIHNHPSGDTSPSEDDAAMTARIRSAARIFDITLHDHIIIGRSSEFSFRSAGLI